MRSLVGSLFCLFLFQYSLAQNKVTIAWDTSLSMESRDIQKEFDFLENYFSKYTESEVTIVEFNNVNATTRKYNIQEGDWGIVKAALATSTYDGGTAYGSLNQIPQDQLLLLFTDGKENAQSEVFERNGKLYVINSSEDSDQENLKYIALGNKGRIVSLQGALKDKNSLITYSGNVYSEDRDLAEIKVGIKGSDIQIPLDNDGNFKVEASPGAILVFTAEGAAPVEKTLDQNSTLNVFLSTAGIQLDQVELKNEKKRDPNKKAIVDGVIVDKRMEGYATSSIGEEDMTQVRGTVSNAVEGKFSGVTKGQSQDLSQAVIRGTNSIFGNNYPLIIIDGAPVARSNSGGRVQTGVQITDYIDINNIAEVKVLKGYAATNRYGSEGSGGVILITTKLAASRANAEAVNDGTLQNNIYEGKVMVASQAFETPYLQELKFQKNLKDAYELYLDQRGRYLETDLYYTDVSEYFKNSDTRLASQIAYNTIERSNPSITSLRSLYLTAINNRNYSLALDAANKTLDEFPQRIQSYLDVALAQIENKNYQLALDILIGIENGTINPNLDFTSLQTIANNEIKHLVANHKAQLDLSKVKVDHLKAPEMDARIVFDWSNNDANFEFQFVNPDRRFFTWEHRNVEDDRLKRELLNGLNQEEFEINGGTKGFWQINVKYLGNRTAGNTTPTLLHCTVYHNYGRENERMEQKIIRLHEIGSEQQALKFSTFN